MGFDLDLGSSMAAQDEINICKFGLVFHFFFGLSFRGIMSKQGTYHHCGGHKWISHGKCCNYSPLAKWTTDKSMLRNACGFDMENEGYIAKLHLDASQGYDELVDLCT